ncbi:MAG: PEP-CTERM sorting domain-containing protein [bacterium]
MRRFFLLPALLVALATPAFAQVTIGTGAPTNEVAPLGKDSNLGTIPTAIAETFFAPVGQDYLQAFSFFVKGGFGDAGSSLLLSASIYEFSVDHLVGSALFTSASVNGNNAATDQPLSFGGDPNAPLNIFLAPGQMYALVLSSVSNYAATPDGSTVSVGATQDDAFAGGQLFISLETDQAALFNSGAFFTSDDTPDAAFSASLTSAPVVSTPEPASFVLMATGLAGVGLVVKRRRRA